MKILGIAVGCPSGVAEEAPSENTQKLRNNEYKAEIRNDHGEVRSNVLDWTVEEPGLSPERPEEEMVIRR
jgi:hypothetical protein